MEVRFRELERVVVYERTRGEEYREEGRLLNLEVDQFKNC